MSDKKVITLEDRIPKLKMRKRKKANRKFTFYVFLFFMFILLVLYFQSSYSRISSIEVKGTTHVSKQDVIKLSDLTKNKTSFWKINKDKIEKKVSQHEEIHQVTLKRKFPNKIVLHVEEYDRVAYLMDGTKVLPILENGDILKQINTSEIPYDAPLLRNWDQGHELQEMAQELKKVPDSILNHISEIYFEPNETDPLHITLFMNDGYEVSATIKNFSKKIIPYPSIVAKLPKGSKGVIHLDVGYYFKSYNAVKEGESNAESER